VRGWLWGRVELPQCRAQRIQARGVRKSVRLDGVRTAAVTAANSSSVREVNCRHGPDIIGRYLFNKEMFGADAALPDVLMDLASCERRKDFSRPCGARFTDLAARPIGEPQ
jgi:hypothetical protein